jgi:hypothetical protein
MSVKKIGQAVLHANAWRSPRWSVVGGSYYFGFDSRAFASKFELEKKLGVAPGSGKTNYFHQKEEDAYRQKQREFIKNAAIEIEKESLERPVRFKLFKNSISDDGSDVNYCMYRSIIYKCDRPDYSDEELIYQLMELEDKERQKFERLKHKFSLAKQEEKAKIKRLPIPEEVRIAVWRRDDGRCVKCGSRERLEYDHIIPLSKGGSDTVRNIELLCEKCNREKCGNIQ